MSLNNRLQRLQKQARDQRIHLNSMQMEGKPVALQNGLQMQKLQISAVGDFIPCFAGCGRQNAMAVRLKNCACKA